MTVEAGQLALDWFNRRDTLQVALKGPQDYASEADAAVERLLARRLAEAFPEDQFLGEEEGGEVGDQVWVVDPIDGTANFVRGVTRFCVSVAFVAGGTVQLGAIFSPVTDELFLARRGHGATLNGTPIRVAGTDRIERASIEIGWSSRVPYAAYLARGPADARRPASISGASARVRWAWPTSPTGVPTPISSCTSMPGIASPGSCWSRRRAVASTTSWPADGLRRGNPILAAAPGVAEAIAALAGVPLLR